MDPGATGSEAVRFEWDQHEFDFLDFNDLGLLEDASCFDNSAYGLWPDIGKETYNHQIGSMQDQPNDPQSEHCQSNAAPTAQAMKAISVHKVNSK